jgi:uncharacterized protein (UPF0305 family)
MKLIHWVFRSAERRLPKTALSLCRTQRFSPEKRPAAISRSGKQNLQLLGHEWALLVAELKALDHAGKLDEILTSVEACLPKDEADNFIPEQEKSDVVHDLLAFLAKRMLEMNKQKQQEIKGFLGWLEGYVGAKLEDLNTKTKIQSYYKHDYEDLLAVLKKNRKKLAIDPVRREPGEALRAEYEGSVGKLLPLLEMIRQTDELIDAIVYRLYGLTEEEIRIVAGNAD